MCKVQYGAWCVIYADAVTLLALIFDDLDNCKHPTLRPSPFTATASVLNSSKQGLRAHALPLRVGKHDSGGGHVHDSQTHALKEGHITGGRAAS